MYKTRIINIRCIEQFIGALYLDQGLDIVWKFAEKVIFPHVEQNELLGVVDFKTQFQEYVHQQNKGDVTYNLIEEGPAHHRLFTSEGYSARGSNS